MDIREIRKWMYTRFAPNNKDYRAEFVDGVQEFIDYASMLPQCENSGEMRCPCRKCKNRKYQKKDDVHVHLLRWGFVADYWCWTLHGEDQSPQLNRQDGASSSGHIEIPTIRNTYENMVFDAMGPNIYDYQPGRDFDADCNREEPPNSEAQHFYDMLNAAQRPLWPGCETHTELSMGIQMMSIKADYNMSHGCFDRMAQLMASSNPPGNFVPNNFYETKKLVKRLGLTSLKIDCCVNGCMLYYKSDAELNECKFCHQPRFKPSRRGNSRTKNVPYKRMHYLPLIPRLKRLYASSKSAENMTWHSTNRREFGVLCHPSDGLGWKHFDEIYNDFAAEPRNVRLGLCADGFTPFSQTATPYSCWPVIITPYNLPPEMCMTTPYMFLTCLIPGPHNPKSRIDVYLQPLVDELKELWSEGVQAYDVSKKQNFNMRAALMWTINDFPAYGMLSGWMTAGRLACPICMDQTKSFRLKHGGKSSWFDCHRQFLPYDHMFRRNRDSFFAGRTENSHPPVRVTGEDIWGTVCSIPQVINVPPKYGNLPGYGIHHNWTKQSIFWELPYWKDNMVRHNLDVMHIEKNVFDNVFNTVMDVKGKTKDNEKARMDLRHNCRRSGLHLRDLPNGKVVKPKASFTLNDDEKEEVCQWVENLRMPDGYASNLARCVDKSRRKLHGMKSHDCHVFMQRLLPFAFMHALPPTVYKVLTELSQFFKNLCCTELRVDELQQMEKNIPLVLCKLERIFPPAFFDVMEHLPVHLPYEALVCGPVQYRWMYPFERFLHNLKGMVKNRAKVEGSICEAYIAQETTYFASYYFENGVDSRSTRSRRNEFDPIINQGPFTLSIFQKHGRPAGQCTTRWLTDEEYNAASFHVLTQCDEVIPYAQYYKSALRHYESDINDSEVEISFEKHFFKWFKEFVHNPQNNVDNQFLRDLAWGPNRRVDTWQKFVVNGYLFHTESWGETKKTYNSGVSVKGDGSIEFYGKLKEVLQLSYPGLPEKTVVLFNCDWFDTVSNRGFRLDKHYGHMELKISESYPKFDPFILASHVSQVYYIPYPGKRRDHRNWHFVMKTRPRSRVDHTHNMDNAFQEPRVSTNSVVDTDILENLVHPSGSYEEVNVEQVQVSNEYEEDEFHTDESSDETGDFEDECEGEDDEEDDDN